MVKVFIDGKEGTTGLQLCERLERRKDVRLLTLSEESRKDVRAREEMLNAADFAFLCLPDAAAVEAVSLIKNGNTRVIDASTAHRTASGWAYGFPELSAEHRSAIARGQRVAVPGCHASGFIAAAYPLVRQGIIKNDYPFVITSVTGFSGGGKSMIAEYSAGENRELLAPRQYAVGQNHKHLKEMRGVPGLTRTPVFEPFVSDFYCGMQVTTSLFTDMFEKKMGVKELYSFYSEYYSGAKLISVEYAESGFIPSNTESGKNGMRLIISGNDERALAVALYDNLGKGASGAAVQNFNIMLGEDETFGLV